MSGRTSFLFSEEKKLRGESRQARDNSPSGGQNLLRRIQGKKGGEGRTSLFSLPANLVFKNPGRGRRLKRSRTLEIRVEGGGGTHNSREGVLVLSQERPESKVSEDKKYLGKKLAHPSDESGGEGRKNKGGDTAGSTPN